jgi:transposase
MPTIQGISFQLDDEFRGRNRTHTEQERMNLGILLEMEGCLPDALTVASIGSERFLIDGYTTLALCTERGVKPTKPRLIVFPNRGLVLEWIDRRQRARRNLSPEEMVQRREERRDRVVDAKDRGESNRVIAEREGVSEITVRRDIEASTATGVAVGPPNGQIIGKDGISRQVGPQFCERCRSTAPVRDCLTCADLQAKAGKPKRPAKKSGSVKFDFNKSDKDLGRMIRGIDELGRAYPELKKTDEWVEIEALRDGYVKTWKKLQSMATKLKSEPWT